MARNRRRTNPRTRNKDSGPWLTRPELTERLIVLRPHHSARQIAAILSAEFGVQISRNQVIGKAIRLKLPSRPLPKPQYRPRPSRARVAVLPPMPAPPPPPTIAVDRRRLRVATLPIIRQDASLCRWLYDDYPYVCCSEPKCEGSSYCIWHDRKVHIAATQYVPMRRRL